MNIAGEDPGFLRNSVKVSAGAYMRERPYEFYRSTVSHHPFVAGLQGMVYMWKWNAIILLNFSVSMPVHVFLFFCFFLISKDFFR